MHNFDVHLQEFTDGRIAFLGPNGFNRWFTSNSNGIYTASPGDYGLLTRDPNGTFQLREKDGFIYRFRSNLRLDYIQDSNGNRISATYNAANQLTKVTHTNGQSFQFEYNVQGRLSRLIDHVDRATTYAYDASGVHLLNVTAPGNRVTAYTYSLGQGIATDHRLLSIQFPDGTHLYYTYDAQGRLASQEGDGEAGRLTWAYEANGTTRITDAAGGITTLRTNEQKLPTEVTNPLGAVTRYTYDTNLNLTKVTDPLGHIYNLTYDSRGNVTQLTNPLNQIIRFTYESNFNKITSLRDSRGISTTFAYDSRGNLTMITYPNNSKEQFTYTTNGSLQRKTNRAGQAINYTYNSQGLLLSKTYPGGSNVTYTYDSPGNMTSAANNTGTINFQYDSLDRLIRVTYPGGRIFQYQYDTVNKRTRMTDPDGRVLNYEYDAAGRLVRIVDGANQTVVAYQYDAANRRTRKTLSNGVYTTYEYDAVGQIIHLINYAPSNSIISRFDYTYDSTGNRLSKNTIEGTETYSYDSLNQLTGVTYPGGATIQFAYDPMGNRLTVTENGAPTNYTVNNLNQYASVGPTAYGYDANGNLISKTVGGQTTTYTYDVENRLLQVNTPTQTVTYTYDPFGLRNARTDIQGTVRYLWDGDQVAIEESATHITTARYAWGDVLDEAIRMERGGSTYHYAQDALFSISDLVNNSGSAVEHYRYRVFGEPMLQSSLGNPWLFTGAAYDSKAGLQYNRARYYSSALGRFMTTDPINSIGNLNLYAYTPNNPVIYLDHYGYWYVKIEGSYGYFGGQISIGPSGWSLGWTIGFGGGGGASIYPVGNPGSGWSAGGYGYGPGGGSIDYGSSGPSAGLGLGYGAGFGGGYSWGGGWGGGSGGWGGGTGSGTCPTFVQLPPDTKTSTLGTFHQDITQEQIVGKITIPGDDMLLRANIPIFGIAGGKDFKGYRVEYGQGAQPSEWHLIASSTKPQDVLDIDIAKTLFLHGDAHLYGNLATWNTGLKNWVHLPCNPPEDPTDLNGVYTLRLTVVGKDGQKVEDRLTVEVGRVIAQALSGIAISPDQRVVMRFPEHSLTYPFRVYTILPVNEVGEKSPSTPEGSELIGPIYRLREPGDRFTKDVSLEFTASEKELVERNAGHVGIARYDVEQETWLWLPTTYSLAEGKTIFSTTLTELPAPQAIYALVFDPQNAARSQPQVEEKPPATPSDSRSAGVLVFNIFEEGLDQWQPHHRLVGAVLERDKTITPDGSYALKLTSQSYGGNFSVTVLEQPFDVREYPLMSFDYRIGPWVKTDFYLQVNGRWYNLGFTDDSIDFRNRGVNIANLGRLEGIVADDEWHSTSVNLYDLLRQKTGHTQVEAIMMADWDISAYAKLEFGRNPRGATYYLDNFKLAAGSTRKSSETLLVDTFDKPESTNLLGGASGTFSNPGTNYCQTVLVDESAAKVSEGTTGGGNGILELSFDTSHNNAYCGYWTALVTTNLEEMRELSFRLHASEDVPPMLIGLRHEATSDEAKVPLQPYLSAPNQDGWRTASIPLSAFHGLPDLSLTDVLFIIFENSISSGQGAIFLDDFQFRRESTFAAVADFDRYPMEYNLLGGGFRTSEKGAAAISAGYHEDRVSSPTDPIGTVRIAYGGTIGLDYGRGQFSYAIWETDLLGLDARGFQNLVLKMRGEKGGEKPNIYLDDGTTRYAARVGIDFDPLTNSWQEIRLPLEIFSSQGVDLSHLAALQLDFEWEEMSGTIYIVEIRFEEATLDKAVQSLGQTEEVTPVEPVQTAPEVPKALEEAKPNLDTLPSTSDKDALRLNSASSSSGGTILPISISLSLAIGLGLLAIFVLRRQGIAR